MDRECRAPDDRDRRWQAALAHRERLLKIARARTPSLEDAEDIVQEAMLRCVEFEHLDAARLGRFLTSVTMRLCIDEHRRRTQVARLGRRLEAEPMDAPGSDEPVCDRLEARWVATLVAELPPRQREVLHAKAEGMSCGQIGSRYRMSYKAVESALTHARSTIRAALSTASCLVVAALARFGWRSRAVAVAAVPVVAAGLVTTVYHVPAAPDPSRPDRYAGEPQFISREPREITRIAVRTDLPLRRPAARPATALAPARRVEVRPVERESEPARPQEYVKKCAGDGVELHIVVDPSNPQDTQVYQAC